ncbi:MAG: hypothetical protein Q9187_005968 [Circinaria calcarea]
MAECPLNSQPEVMQAHKIIPQANIPAFLLTPPLTNGKSSLPITPEKRTVQEVLEIFKRHQQGLLKDQDLILLPLRSSSYTKLREQLKADDSLREYVDNTIRLDYDPVSELLTIKMTASPAHETVTAAITQSVSLQLENHTTGDGPVATYARKIYCMGTSRIYLLYNEVEFEKSPDNQFIHLEASYPGVVFEISYSQEGANLESLAETYILCSNGDIRVVVGIDMDYPSISSASVSLWQAKYIEEPDTTMPTVMVDTVVKNQVISESINHPFKLDITLDKFGPEEFAINLKETPIPVITITMTDLARAIQRARIGRIRESRRQIDRAVSKVRRPSGLLSEDKNPPRTDDSNNEAEDRQENRETDQDSDDKDQDCDYED